MTLPPCPSCERALNKVGAEAQGHVWTDCPHCKQTALVRLTDQVIVRIGKP